MKPKKLGRALFFPSIAVMVVLVPIAAVLLVYSMAFVGAQSVISYVSYVLATYTLTVWCLRIPRIVVYWGDFRNKNKYARRWLNDIRLRENATLYGAFLLNSVYAVFQLWLGIYHSSFWFLSMSGYYLSLALMRYFLARYTAKNKPGENMPAELVRYRACGWILLVMNLALSLMIFFMVYWNRTFNHREITAIAMAAYTFTAFTMAIVNIIKYRKYNSPVYSASKAVSLAAACVSMLTLESTMLTTFGDESMDAVARKIMLGASGGAVSVFIAVMAVYIISRSTKKIKLLRTEVQNNGEQ